MKILLITNQSTNNLTYYNCYIEYFKKQDGNYLIYFNNENSNKSIKYFCINNKFLPDIILIDYNYINFNINKLLLTDINFNKSIICLISHKDMMSNVIDSNIKMIKEYNINYIFHMDCKYYYQSYNNIDLNKIYKINNHIRVFPINYGFEKNVFNINSKITKNIDFGFSGIVSTPYNTPINLRKNLLNRIENICIKNNLKYNFLFNKRYSTIKEYSNQLLQTKIWIDTPTDGGHISARLWELPLHKCVILVLEDSIYTNILKDGVNSIIVKNDLSNLEEKIIYYMKNEIELQKIANYAFNEFNEKHTIEQRFNYILDKLK